LQIREAFHIPPAVDGLSAKKPIQCQWVQHRIEFRNIYLFTVSELT